jgi:hypothetical protein
MFAPPELRPLINIVFSPVFMQLSIYILIASAFFFIFIKKNFL